MAQPTREQFEAAAQRVMETAPPGLSREDFFALIDKEVASPQSSAPLRPGIDYATSGLDGPPKGEPEPDTWGGGFLKSLKDQFFEATAGNPLIQSAAQPQSMGDFLSLVLPSQVAAAPIAKSIGGSIPNIRERMSRGLSSLGRAVQRGSESMRPLSIGSPTLTTIRKALDLSGRGIEKAAGGRRLAKGYDRYLPNKLGYQTPRDMSVMTPPESLPTSSLSDVDRYMPNRSGYTGPSAVLDDVGDLPTSSLSEVDRYMPNTSGYGESAGGASFSRIPYRPQEGVVPSSQMSPRIAGKSPTLEDELILALEDVRAPESPSLVSGAPEQAITSGGPLRQSGVFSRSERIGQPGGYSSGRPATRPDTPSNPLEDLLNAIHGEEGSPNIPSGHGTFVDDATELGSRSRSPLGPGAPPPAASEVGGASAIRMTPEQVAALTPGEWMELRRMYGARDLARMTGKSADEIRSRLAPGPSRTPLVAEERIRNAANKARYQE